MMVRITQRHEVVPGVWLTPGTVANVEAAVGAAWCAAGWAVPEAIAKRREAAVAGTLETAIAPGVAKRNGKCVSR